MACKVLVAASMPMPHWFARALALTFGLLDDERAEQIDAVNSAGSGCQDIGCNGDGVVTIGYISLFSAGLGNCRSCSSHACSCSCILVDFGSHSSSDVSSTHSQVSIS